jgi:hypothetical protein
MSEIMLKYSLLALTLFFTAATIDVAEAGGTARKQRGGSGQIMRLGGPTGGTAATNGGFVDRTGGPSFRSNADVARFFQDQRQNRGPG